ncbi:amidase [Devosia sp. ZB163]|uniref:amidase n=1 Tax=Devosia sp. ZB163 TaxID=3025938 RepID=UPI00235F2E8E|nr:amidase [Devosia sp. ZB163]MDC9826276.1 amidase [Devosia sp. ZB163]
MDAKAPHALTAGEDLHYLSLTAVSELIRTGVVSPVEVTRALLDRIGGIDGQLKSYTTVTAEHALASARKAESELGQGIWRGPLHGVPVAVKDLCDTTFAPTSAGTFIHRDHMAASNATVVDRLESAGAVILGKLSMTEGAWAGHHPRMKTPVSPWADDVWTGASSSGSGVATAAGLCYGSLGSDTGGSIRLPSTACGLTGVKPSWGRVSRAGVWALADSLDHVGPMTRTVADAAAMLGAIAGHDARDTTTLNAPVPNYLAALGGSVAGLRVGIDENYIFTTASEEVAAMMWEAIAAFEALGARIVPVTFPSMDEMGAHWTTICAAECAAAHGETYPTRKDEYGPVLTALLEIGHGASAKQLAEAMQYRLKINGAVAKTMLGCDLLLVPAIPYRAPEASMFARSMTAEEFDGLTRFTAVFDMTGQPTLSLSGGADARGVPMGFQLVGNGLDEALLFTAGHAYQSVTSWHARHPELS